MVHLASVPSDKEVDGPLVAGMEKIKLEQPTENEVSESIYGSRFAAEGLPAGSMPDGEM